MPAGSTESAKGPGVHAPPRRGRSEGGASLSRAILRSANRGLTRIEFLREVSSLLMGSCACDAVEIWLWKDDLHYRFEAAERPQAAGRFELSRREASEDRRLVPRARSGTDLERLCVALATQRLGAATGLFSPSGSFCTGDAWQPFTMPGGPEGREATSHLCIGGHYRSLAVARFVVDEGSVGLLHLKREPPDGFAGEEVEFFEEIAQELGLGIAAWRAQAALRERIKELTCLYGIAQIMAQPGISLEEALERIVHLLPPAWQYPHNAAARIVLDGHCSETPGFRPGRYRQSADVWVGDLRRGSVEVVYPDETAELAGRPFLKEEEKLIEAVARQLALVAERRQTEQEKTALQHQLIHADRLATIGQLAAGVAHELNEPLGSILGFAQLARKCSGLPEQAARDMEKIITASLYAREVIRKLMVFARQVPARKTRVGLTQTVEEALHFLESRCARSGIEVVRRLAPELSEITADGAQLKQVLVNLAVNAIQAMPDGGTLTVCTRGEGSDVILEVTDTGTGMSAEVLERAFLPFFTTKDVNEGTGLGLAVVHGIATSHGGSVEADSEPGRGTRFEVRLPIDGPARPEESEQVADDA